MQSFVTIWKSDYKILAFNLLHLANNCSDTGFRKCVYKRGSVCCLFYSKVSSERNEKSTQIASNVIDAVFRLCSRSICDISMTGEWQ